MSHVSKGSPAKKRELSREREKNSNRPKLKPKRQKHEGGPKRNKKKFGGIQAQQKFLFAGQQVLWGG